MFMPEQPFKRSGVTLLAAVLAELPKMRLPGPATPHSGLGIPYALPNNKLTVHWLARHTVACGVDSRAGPHCKIRSATRASSTKSRRPPVSIRSRSEFAISTIRAGSSCSSACAPSRNGSRAARARAMPAPSRAVAVCRTRNMSCVRTYVAVVADVTVDRTTGAIKVDRVFVVHDCGQIINPDGLRNQIEGNVVQTVSRSVVEKVTFSRSAVTSLNWGSYPILTFPNVPEVVIDLIDRPNEVPWGAGEPTTSVIPSAIANAVFDATGARVRSVPFRPAQVLAALKLAKPG